MPRAKIETAFLGSYTVAALDAAPDAPAADPEPSTAPETPPAAPQDAQEAPPPKFTEDLPFTV